MKKGEEYSLVIGHLYPDLLNLYGDRGNIKCMEKRCRLRGINVRTVTFEYNDTVDFSGLDIVLLGGGALQEQYIVCQKLKAVKDELKAYVENGGVLIAICEGLELLGKYYQTDKGDIEALGILDIYTKTGSHRLINNIILKNELWSMPIVGFENHLGRTFINNYKPFGKVLYGYGNDDKCEGVMYKNVIGTYLHGPLLPKNPQVCDYLIKNALEKKYSKSISLPILDDKEEKDANAFMFKKLMHRNY